MFKFLKLIKNEDSINKVDQEYAEKVMKSAYSDTKVRFILYNQYTGEYEFVGTVQEAMDEVFKSHIIFGGLSAIVSIENNEESKND